MAAPTASRKEFLSQLARDYAHAEDNGAKLKQSLLATGMPLEAADAMLKVADMACSGAVMVKMGQKRETIIAKFAPPDSRDDFAIMLDAAIGSLRLETSDGRSVEEVLSAIDSETNSFASRPAKIKLEAGTWFWHAKGMISLIGGVLLIPALGLIVVAAFYGESIALFAAILMILFVVITERIYKNMKRLFEYGLLAPGVVVSVDPVLLASLANVGRNGNDVYAVKIDPGFLLPSEARKLGVGGTLPVICGFDEDENDSSRWKSYDPMAIHMGSTNKKTFTEAMSRIPAEDWSDLDQSVGSLTQEQLRTPGLYLVPTPPSVRK